MFNCVTSETKKTRAKKKRLFDFRLQQCILMFRVAAGVSFYRSVPFAISYFILAWVCNINLFGNVQEREGAATS